VIPGAFLVNAVKSILKINKEEVKINKKGGKDQ